MSKLLKSDAVGLPEFKNQQERKFDEACRVRICICEKKNRKSNDEKSGDKQKKQDS